jgi:hypothetical protein
MGSPRSVHLLLLFVLSLALCGHGFCQQGVPPGYQLLTDPQTSGGLLITQRQGVTAATPLLIHAFNEAATFFDGRPRATGGARDAQYDQQAEAGFQATIQRAPVAGVAIATVRGGVGTVGFAFDSPNMIARTLPRLLQLGGSTAGGPQGGCPPPPVNWRVEPYPDGSGQIQLPEGWRITGAYKGAVSAEGPHGRINRFHSFVMTRAAAVQATQMLPGSAPPLPVADPTDPATVLVAVWSHISAANQRQGLPPFRITRIVKVEPQPPVQGFVHTAFIELELETQGAIYYNRSLVNIGTPMAGNYLHFESNVAARTECFAQNYVPLMQILISAKTSSHIIRERLDSARRSSQEASDIMWQTIQNRNRAQDRSHANWTEAFRGTRIVEDTRTGRWHDVDLAYSADTVRKLNEREGYDRYREIPLRDLNP